MVQMKWWRLAAVATITLGLYGCPSEEPGDDPTPDAGAQGGAGGSASGGTGGGEGGAGGEAGMGGAGGQAGMGGGQGGAGGGIGGAGGEGGQGGMGGGAGGMGGQGGMGGMGGQGGAGGEGGMGGQGGEPCAPVACELACEFGFATGPDGCEICECLPPPAMCRADDDCPQPGAPNCSAYCVDGQCQVRCEEPPPVCPDPEDPNVAYIAEDPARCAVIDFGCPPGAQGFDNECGCGCITVPNACEPVLCDLFCEFGFQRDDAGCEICACVPAPAECRADADCPVPPRPGCISQCVDGACAIDCNEPVACPDPADPAVTYVNEDPAQCALIRFACDEGEEAFSNECGCGCIARDLQCPDPADPNVSYVSEDPAECARVRFVCEAGQQPFSNECGCGCVGEPDACICPEIYSPVCGADGRTYGNACEAGCANVAIVARGECPDVPPPDECICPAIFAPVCGADGNTYGNACQAACVQVAVVAEGACPDEPNMCPDPADPAVSYVSQDPERCAVVRFACAPGQQAFNNECGCGCIGEPELCLCPDVFDPVCGADGNTYPNACQAGCANVAIVARGECGAPPEECLCPEVIDPVCGADGNTYNNACLAACANVPVVAPGACAEPPPPGECICPAIFAPVCGVDGNTYPNACEAGCAEVAIAARGECPPAADCPDADDPAVTYISEDPARCAIIRFRCEAGQEAFSNECGCGCIDVAP